MAGRSPMRPPSIKPTVPPGVAPGERRLTQGQLLGKSTSPGGITVPNNTATTVVALAPPSAQGGQAQLVTWGGGGWAGGGYAIIVVANGVYSIAVQAAVNGGGTIALSGNNVQLTQTSGSTQTVYARAFPLT